MDVSKRQQYGLHKTAVTHQIIHCTCETITDAPLSGWTANPASCNKSTSHTKLASVSSSLQHKRLSTTTSSSNTNARMISHTHIHHQSNPSNSAGNFHSATKRLMNFHHQDTIPDIPFRVSQVHRHKLFRRLEESSAHIGHYLSSYTYPCLEHRLAASLPPQVVGGEICSSCATRSLTIPYGAGTSGKEGGELKKKRKKVEGLGNQGKVRAVKPNVIQMPLEETSCRSNLNHYLSQVRCELTLS